jgi:aminopeptidase N
MMRGSLVEVLMNKRLPIFLIAVLVLAGSCRKPAPSPAAGLDGPIGVMPEPVSYDLKIDADVEEGTLAGDCTLRLKNASAAPIQIVPLNLYRLMEVSAVTDGSGQALPFTQNVRVFEDWNKLQVNHIRAKLGAPLEPGQETTLRVVYGGPLLGYAEAMRYVKDHIGLDLILVRTDSLAYPQIAVPSWKTNRAAGLKDFDFTVSLTVPAQLVVANSGELLSKTEKDGRATYVYRSKVPSWRIDLAAADYTLIEGESGRFRIFAFPADAEGGRQLLGSLTAALDLYTRWFGPLEAFPGLTVIEVPEGYGSQADKVAVIQEAGAFKDPAGRYTFYHELSHLWNVTANDPLPCRFESEGLAMFLQHLLQEKLEGRAGAAKDAARDMLGRLAKQFAKHPDWKTVPMIDYGVKDITDLSYTVGQVFFYLLYDRLGEEAFLRTIAGFYRDYRQAGATTRQFVESVKAQAGVDLDKLFEEWVLTPRGAELIAAGTPLEDLERRYR